MLSSFIGCRTCSELAVFKQISDFSNALRKKTKLWLDLHGLGQN